MEQEAGEVQVLVEEVGMVSFFLFDQTLLNPHFCCLVGFGLSVDQQHQMDLALYRQHSFQGHADHVLLSFQIQDPQTFSDMIIS